MRGDRDYIENQKQISRLSLYVRQKDHVKKFIVYYDNILIALSKSNHYKYLKAHGIAPMTLKDADIKYSTNEIDNHQRLLCTEQVNTLYSPYFEKSFRWTNQEKLFIARNIRDSKINIFPGEVLDLLNQYRQKPEKYDIS